MELMSSLRFLLFCSLAVLCKTRGNNCEPSQSPSVKVNNSLTFGQKQLTRKHLLLNVNGPPLVSLSSELQTVFQDLNCRNCTNCMERAIKASKRKLHLISNRPKPYELFYELLKESDRNKRSTVGEYKIEMGKAFLAAVTKYKKNNKVVAIEVKPADGDKAEACSAYSVRKYLSCDEGSGLPRRKKSHKKSKKIKKSLSTTTTAKMEYKRRRDVENSQVSESFMPSIEDFY